MHIHIMYFGEPPPQWGWTCMYVLADSKLSM